MKADLFFSIIVPTYNRADFISKTIQSVLIQTYPIFELIIVDDGSTDNTEQVVRTFDDKRLFYYKKHNAERAAARNYGIERAHGAYVTFLDSDDMVYPNLFKTAFEIISKHNSPPFFHLGFEIKNSADNVIGRKQKIKNENSFRITKGNYISCIGVFIRKDIISRFRFNEDIRLSGSEDWELWLRVVANVGVRSDNRVVACFTQHDNRSVVNITEAKLLLRKNLSFEYAFQDKKVAAMYTHKKKMMEAFFDLYISLHLALAKQSKRSFYYLRNAFVSYPKIIFEKRFYAALKHGLLSVFNK